MRFFSLMRIFFAAVFMTFCAMPCWALLEMTSDQVASILGPPVGTAVPVKESKTAFFYDRKPYRFYVAYDEDDKAIYVRVDNENEKMSHTEALKLVEQLEAAEKWTRTTMPDVNTWAWENETEMKRAEYDGKEGRAYLFDLRWQDRVAGKVPRQAPVASTKSTPGTTPAAQPRLTEKQAKMLQQMLPKKLPKVAEVKAEEEESENGGTDFDSKKYNSKNFNRHIRPNSQEGTEGGDDGDQ